MKEIIPRDIIEESKYQTIIFGSIHECGEQPKIEKLTIEQRVNIVGQEMELNLFYYRRFPINFSLQ